MFATLRNAIAKFISTKQTAQCNLTIEAGTKNLTYGKMPSFLADQQAHESQAIKGEFPVSSLSELNSVRLRDAICGLGSWSALARAFNGFNIEHEKPVSRRDFTKINSMIDEFHAWNSAAQSQMDEDAVNDVVTRLADVQPPKGNNSTDMIIARVRKCSVEDIRADREKKAAIKAARRADRIVGFVETVWSWTTVETDYSLPMMKVLNKACQTLEWVGGWDAFDPAQVAAELLLIEDDIRTLEKMSKRARNNDDGSDFQDGVLTADGMMRQTRRA